MTIELVKSSLTSHLRQYEFEVLTLMPYTSTVFGCAVCYVYWVDKPDCWVCEREGVLLADPVAKVEMFKDIHNHFTGQAPVAQSSMTTSSTNDD